MLNSRWSFVCALVLIFAAIYAPDVGHGFVKDDFQWISDARQLLDSSAYNGRFYRPIVAASFRANYELFGLRSYPYGLTNLALALACAVLAFWLARSFGLGANTSVFGAAVWAFNFHGINMSVLWISGRTALWLTLFSLLAAIAFLRGRKALCLLWIAAALLSKEEAVLLPLVLIAWHVIQKRDGSWWWLLIPLPLYAALRLQTNAITPLDAPEFYQFTFAPVALARNFLEYFDRSWTFALIGLALLWCFGRPALTGDRKRMAIAYCGVVWFLGGIGLTLFLPVRSNLYACGPSVGAALVAAAMADGWFERMTERQSRRAAIAAIVTLVALIPVYRARNDRWVEIANLSNDTMAMVDRCVAGTCDSILLEDDPRTRRNFRNAFGTFGTAAQLFLGRDVMTDLIAEPTELPPSASDHGCVLHIRLVNDVLDARLRGLACD